MVHVFLTGALPAFPAVRRSGGNKATLQVMLVKVIRSGETGRYKHLVQSRPSLTPRPQGAALSLRRPLLLA